MKDAPPPSGSQAPSDGVPKGSGQKLWSYVTMPWLAPLLGQTGLCRALLAAVVIVGVGHLLGWSLWPCFFAKLTGLPCPGCGMTRAVTALLKGEWGLAMRYHPFAPGFLVLGVLLAVEALGPKSWRQWLVKAVDRMERRTCLPMLFLLCAFIYGLLRMGGLCTSPPISPSPVRAWLQERMTDGG